MSAELKSDEDPYPNEEEVKRVKSFRGSSRQFVEMLRELWHWPDFVNVARTTDRWGRENYEVRLCTGGWSGNEALVNAVEKTLFRDLWWESSRRGGLYVYRIPVEMWNEVFDFGLPFSFPDLYQEFTMLVVCTPTFSTYEQAKQYRDRLHVEAPVVTRFVSDWVEVHDE